MLSGGGDDDIVEVDGVGYAAAGDFTVGGRCLSVTDSPAVARLLEVACLCNNADYNYNRRACSSANSIR